MKVLNRKNAILFALTFAIGSFFSQCQNDPKQDTAKEKEKQGVFVNDYNLNSSANVCESFWFPHSSTPAPMEGIGSPFDTNSTTNLLFHQWSWQKFLWLTKETNGIPLFRDSLTQISNQLIPIDTTIMGTDLILTDIGQAGSNGFIISNSAFNGIADTVYYSIHGDESLIHLSDSMKTVMLKDRNKLNNSVAFPVGALEVKVSWVNANTIPVADRKNYYTTLAYITTIKDTATMAALGMHVVGVVINHPEFIWATFEHKNMAPLYNWDSTTTTADYPVTSSEEMLFFNTTDTASVKNIIWEASTSKSIFSVFSLGIPKTAGGSFMPNLSQDSATNQSNQDNIENLNTCVTTTLGSTDVWSNYFYDGSIWANTDGLSPSKQIDTLLTLGSIGNVTSNHITRGALAASNLTMETFEQAYLPYMHDITSKNIINCFSCHSTVATIVLGKDTFTKQKSPLYFSHVFRSYMSEGTGVTIKEIEKLRIMEMIEVKSSRPQ
ncbi:MAG: hypothetical protein ACJA1Z_003615 [Patiriisocius sp.]|jgi:hypothetical protein